MRTRPPDLPDYGTPPIDEVAICVVFNPIERFAEPHAGLFWHEVRDEYPRAETHPRIEGPIEDLSQTDQLTPTITIRTGMPQGRTWLVSDNDAYLLQIQDNRFIANWRRRGDEYPHFERLFERFEDGLQRFSDLVVAEKLEQPAIRQLEVTYINWIPDMEPTEFFGPAQPAAIEVPNVVGSPGSHSFGSRYLVVDQGEPVGRLYVQCNEAYRPVQIGFERATQFTLMFRAPIHPDSSSPRLADLAFDGRDAIVRAFTALTTHEAHVYWGKTP